VEQGFFPDVVTGVAEGLIPKGRPGDRRIFGEDRFARVPHQVDARLDFPGFLPRKAAEQIDPDVRPPISRFLKVGDGLTQLFRRYLAPGCRLPRR